MVERNFREQLMGKRIEVGEARKVNGQRICDVKVVYRYVGSVDDALAQERQEAYEKAI